MKQLRSWASGGNTVGGHNALWSRTIGNYDTAVGFFSRKAVTFAEFNTASAQVPFFNNAHQNTATGVGALNKLPLTPIRITEHSLFSITHVALSTSPCATAWALGL